MALLKALREAPRLLREQPILFVPMTVFAVLQTPQLFVETLDPIASLVASLLVTGLFVLVTPVFYAGTIGMANDAATGTRTSLDRFWSHAKEFYVSVLGAYFAILVATFGIGLTIAIAAFVAFVAISAAEVGLAFALAAGGVIALVGFAFLLALFAMHLYAHAIVIEGESAVAGLSRSVHVVRRNIKTMAGYGVLAVVAGGLFGGLFALVINAAFPSPSAPGEPAPMPDLFSALVGSAASIVGTALFTTFFVVFTVVLYRDLVGADDASRSGVTTGRNATAFDDADSSS